MKKVVLLVMLVMGIIGHSIGHRWAASSDSYIRNRVVKLYSELGSCSGIQVKTPSNHVVILTAAHCRGLAVDGKLRAEVESGASFEVHILAMDIVRDIMITSPVDANFIEIASGVTKHQSVHSMTHGSGMPTYRTDGELLTEMDVMIVSDPSDCSGPNQELGMTMMGIVCMSRLHVMMSTARVIPGSSGGAVVNDAGELVGIVSNTDGNFAGLITLSDIKDFLQTK